MRLLKTMLRALGLADRPRLDPSFGDPAVAAIRADLARGEWRSAEAHLARSMSADDRAFYKARFADWKGRPVWLDAWVAAKPRDATPRLLRGAHSVRWAWEARGSGWGDSVSDQAASLFLQRLMAADRDLHAAAELDPADATPWAELIPAARGLNKSLDESMRLFGELTRRAPLHWRGHWEMLQNTCEKWGGSNQAMFQFARSTSAAAPDGSSLPSLLAMAHLEYFMARGRADPSGDALRYFSQPQVHRELMQAGERSVLNPRVSETRSMVEARNLFALAFAFMGEKRLAREQFDRLGSDVTDFPWCYRGNPAWIFWRFRLACG